MAKATDEELAEFGLWAIWAYRQPNGIELFRERGAKCEHGELCETCFAESRTEVARIAQGLSEIEPS